MLASLLLLLVGFAGLLGASWWGAVIGGCVLTLARFGERWRIANAGNGDDRLSFMPAATPASVINGFALGGAAFAMGRMCGWLWVG